MNQPLAERVRDALTSQPGRTAREIARALSAERRAVSRCLHHALAGQVRQDASYRWYLRDQRAAAPEAEGHRAVLTELGRLCRYYLECIGQDANAGVSTFAANRHGDPDYTELPSLPVSEANYEWWNVPGAERVLRKVKGDRAKLQAWIGYPVRIREHRTARWHGFFVEPVMLWAVTLPERPGDPYEIADELPVFNFAFLRSVAMGDPAGVVEEAARLDEELGLNAALEDRPEVDEVIERLVAIRPDWDWREPIEPPACSQEGKLSEITQSGIYNRAVLVPSERSPYTQGLESELKRLGDREGAGLEGTALGQWLSADLEPNATIDNEPLIEVLPMNSEQRAAVQSALSSSHTVVTGPPGTGKSQVVTNLLVNAAWRGMKVLFASRNNKAVDVVEARVNGLGNRPVLLRLGSRTYQAKLAEHMTAMLSGHASEDDRVSYEESLARHRELSERVAELDRAQKRTMEARNRVDQLEREAESLRLTFGEERFHRLEEDQVRVAEALLVPLEQAIDRLDPDRHTGVGRIALWLDRKRRIAELNALMQQLAAAAKYFECHSPVVSKNPVPGELRAFHRSLRERVNQAKSVLAYLSALDTLRTSESFEDIARRRAELSAEIAENSARLWRDWVQLTPSRLTAQQRREVADYAALLRVVTEQSDGRGNANAQRRVRELQGKVNALFSCWAITSLSAKNRVPLAPGQFDLLVIDEASQCDIASALPLLFRAKRTVIIGDPMQLRHISALSRSKDVDLQTKYGLLETRAAWMYSVNSLYDLAAAVAGPGQIINLRDHHRSHADIINFSNRKFYEGKLRVATRYTHLKRPPGFAPGVVWTDVKGRVVRPGGRSACNREEADGVVRAMRDLLVERGYEGSVGVVTPFRAQMELIQELLALDSQVHEAAGRASCLVDTVHGFQGDERDVMFFSPVVSEGVSSGALGFLRSNGNLFNVAITRARGLLHVVGDRAAALDSGIDYLADFAAYIAEIGASRASAEPDEVPEFGGPEYPVVARPERVSDWERLFYKALYAAGVRTVPQYSVEQYDLDFAVFAGDRRLNLEVDGERYHRSWTGELCMRDQLRNQRLIELGWDVKRFWVYEIRDCLPECVAWVQNWVKRAEGQSRQ